MVGKIITVSFNEEYSSLCDGHSIEISELFSKDYFIESLIASSPCHLVVKVKLYDESDDSISVTIQSYNSGEGSFSPFQVHNTESFTRIKRIKIIGGSDTPRLFGMGLKNNPTKGSKTIKDQNPSQSPDTTVKLFEPKKEDSENTVAPLITNHKRTLHIKYPIEKLTFNDGNVSFPYKIDDLNASIEVSIENDFIKQIHDSIRPYFSNILNTKYVNVVISLRYTSTTGSQSRKTDIERVDSKSPEIDRITPDLIEKVKLHFVRSQFGKTNMNEKSLLTKDDLILAGANNENAKEIFESDEDLFEAVLKITNTKHHEHLLFLSEIHDHKTMRLRFVRKPISFMFLVAGESNFHFVWETSDTKEASYIWSVPKSQLEKNSLSLKRKLDQIDLIITDIIQFGKNQYIQKKEENFTRIIHTYTENLDGFNRWKQDLQSLLGFPLNWTKK